MAESYPYICKEFTPATTGARAPGGPHYLLDGAVDYDHFAFSDRCSDGQQFQCMVRSPGGPGIPPNFEQIEATYIAATNSIRPDLVLASSNGGSAVVWTGQVLTIYASAPSNPMNYVLDRNAPLGIQVRNAKYQWAARSLANTADFLSISNADGIGGNPTFNPVYQPLRLGTGGTDAQYTITKLLMNLAWIQQLTSTWVMRGPTGSSDAMLGFTKIGTQNYLAQIGVGGALKRILSIADIPQLIDLDFKFSTTTSVSTLQTDTAITFATPDTADAGETYAHVLLGFVHILQEAVTGAGAADTTALPRIRKDGSVARASRVFLKNNGTSNIYIGGPRPVFHAEAISPGTSVTWDLSAGLETESTLDGDSLGTGNTPGHALIGACLRLT